MTIKQMLAAAVALAVAFPLFACAAGIDEAPAAKPKDPDYVAGKAAVDRQDWSAAVESFNRVVAKDARDADAQNMLGYSYRKSGNLDEAFKHYGEALRLNPKHRGAHEYIGEAYLMRDDLAKAKEHLAQLDRICFFGCEEYKDLKAAIAAYEKKPRQ